MRRLMLGLTIATCALIAAPGAGVALAAGPVARRTETASPSAPTPASPSAPGAPSALASPPASTPPSAPAPPVAPASPVAPAPPVAARVRLRLSGTFRVGGGLVTVTGRAVAFRGLVRPYVAGQWVQVQSYVGTRLLATELLRVKPSGAGGGGAGGQGAFTATVRSPAAGVLRVRVTHPATAAMGGFSAQRALTVLGDSARPGSRGLLVELVQQRLRALHFHLPWTGVFDQGTQLALDAYHRLLGWGEGNRSLGAATVNDLLDGRGTFAVRFPHQGRHAEGDLTHQVLALVDGSRVQAIYPISSGKPSTPTILGSFRVYYRVPGYLPDGMYYSDFFITGYAIHGYDPAPDHPASHGCMRLPIVDAIPVFNWLALGDWVDTYYR